MSSSLGSIVAQTGSIAASAQGGAVRGGEASAVATGGNAAATAATSSGGAAVVSLSASSKDRAASRGEARQVDAAFEKQSSNESSSQSGKGKTLNVSA